MKKSEEIYPQYKGKKTGKKKLPLKTHRFTSAEQLHSCCRKDSSTAKPV